MKTYGGVFLTSALVGGEWSASRLGRFTPREKALGTHVVVAVFVTCQHTIFNMSRFSYCHHTKMFLDRAMLLFFIIFILLNNKCTFFCKCLIRNISGF
jgi:hypothetical protein